MAKKRQARGMTAELPGSRAGQRVRQRARVRGPARGLSIRGMAGTCRYPPAHQCHLPGGWAGKEVSKVHPQPEIRTSQTQLLGTTRGIIVTAVVAVVGLVVLLVPVFLADSSPEIRRLITRRQREVSGSRSTKEISSGQRSRPWERVEDRDVPPAGHLHGKPSSWLLVAMVMGAFTTGGVAIIVHAWWLFWACAGIVVLAIPAGKLIGTWTTPSPGAAPHRRPQTHHTIRRPGPGVTSQSPPEDRPARARQPWPAPDLLRLARFVTGSPMLSCVSFTGSRQRLTGRPGTEAT
jgi:hypothetical protein